jgi:hypothetical protein
MAEPAEVQETVPNEAIAGLTWRFDISLSDYSPNDGWACKVAWRGIDAVDETGVPNADNSGWEFTVSPTETNKPTGLYFWTMYVEQGSDKFVVANGSTFVIPNPIDAKPGALQPFAEKALAIVEAQLLSRYKVDTSQMMLRQRQVLREDISKLESARARLQSELMQMRSAQNAMGRDVVFTPMNYL